MLSVEFSVRTELHGTVTCLLVCFAVHFLIGNQRKIFFFLVINKMWCHCLTNVNNAGQKKVISRGQKIKYNKVGSGEEKGFSFGWELSQGPMFFHLLNIVEVPGV